MFVVHLYIGLVKKKNLYIDHFGENEEKIPMDKKQFKIFNYDRVF